MSTHCEVLAQHPRRDAFQGVHQPRHRQGRRVLDEQVHMLLLPVALDQDCPQVLARGAEDAFQELDVLGREDFALALRHEDQMHVTQRYNVSTCSGVRTIGRGPSGPWLL